MSVTSVKLEQLYGLKGDVKNNIQYLDELNVLYPCGYNVINYNMEKKTQQFISLSKNDVNNNSLRGQTGTGEISAMALTTAKSGGVRTKLLAVAERASVGSKPSVTVFEVNPTNDASLYRKRGKAPIESKDVGSHEYVSICFSPDGKYLLTQGGAPDWTLVNWQWEKSRPLQAAKVSNKLGAAIHQCSYCPTDPTVVCVSGNCILRFLHLEQNEFKSIPFTMGKRPPQNYTCHAWIDDRILVGTDTGDILVFENAEFRGVLSSSPSDGKSIDSICAFSRGFVCGCDEGVLYVFERDEKEIYKASKSFQIEGNFVRIKNIAISPSEDNVICTLENNQAYVLGLSNTDILKSEEMNFEPLSFPFHHLNITGMDLCLRKPLVATCGLDRSVRVWNFQTYSLEVLKFFPEQPLSLAFHPSGLHLVVGFSDSLRLMNLLMDEIKPYKDFAIKGCREVQFSHGGQYFAAANGTVVQVYMTYTCEMISSFGNHKGKVYSIEWKLDDSAIISAGMAGGVYQWTLDGKMVTKPPSKKYLSCNYTSAVLGHDNKTYTCGSDQRLKVFDDQGDVAEDLEMPVTLTQLALVHAKHKSSKPKLVLAGTENGMIRTMPYPLEGKAHSQVVHSGAVTRMRVSADGAHLFTVAEDGSFAQYLLEGRQKTDIGGLTAIAGGNEGGGLGSYTEEILIAKSDLEEKMSLIHDLQHKVEELQHHNEVQLQLTEMRYKEKLRDITTKFKSELEIDRARHHALEDEKESLTQQFHLKLQALTTAQTQKLSELRTHHKSKLKAESERYAELDRRIAAMHQRWDEQTQERETQYAAEKAQLDVELQKKREKEAETFARLEKEREAVLLDMETTIQWMKEDADQEIDELKASFDKKLTHERKTTLTLKDQNAILKRKFGALRDDINENLDELQNKKATQLELYAQIESSEKDIKGHLKEIKEREATIQDKVNRIFELRKKNQELEKFKFVLDYKITELQRQIRPRELEMKTMSEQIEQMEAELKGYRKEASHLQLDIRQLKLKYNGMDKETQTLTQRRKEVAFQLRRFKTELHETYLHINDPKMLKDGIKLLYQRFVTKKTQIAHPKTETSPSSSSSSKSSKSAADDLQKDYQRQRKFLERSVDSLNGKLQKDMMVHKKDNMRIMQENIALIKEINQLRREIAILRNSQKLKEQMKRASRKARLESMAEASSVRRSELEGAVEKHQEQIRTLKNQISFYQNLVLEDDLGNNSGLNASRPQTSEGGNNSNQPQQPLEVTAQIASAQLQQQPQAL